MVRRRWLGALLCVLGSQQLKAVDCEGSQKTILSLNKENQDRLIVENISYADQKAFVASKPQIHGSQITTGSFVAEAQGYEQLWCKLKSQEAVLAATEMKSEGPTQDCSALNRLQSEEALASLGLAKESLVNLGINFTADQDFATGAQWAPSSVAVTRKGDTVSIQAMRLKSPNWLPVIGGMNYCKILSAAGALQLVQEQLAKPQPIRLREHTTQKIEWTGGLNSTQSAWLWLHGDVNESLQAAKGTFIISPGGEVPPEAMWGLADQLTDLGYLTLIVQYPKNMAIIDTISLHGNSAIRLAQKIKTAPQDIKGMAADALQGKPIYVFGHSLGGATLADEVYHGNQPSVFDHIFLYGTASFVKLGGKIPTSSPLTFLFGENDGLTINDIPGVLKNFDITFDPTVFTPVTSGKYPNVSYQRLQSLNHFCIISDQSIGNPSLKKKDGAGLEPEDCLKTMIQAMGI